MSKRRHLIGFSLLLVMLLLPSSAIAFTGGPENARSPLETALDQLLGLVTHLLLLTTEEVDGRCIADPWGCPAGLEESDLVAGWDPWE